MSCCFYNANGTMLGADLHEFAALIPAPPPLMVPTFHLTFAIFSGQCDAESTRLAHVTSSAHPTLQGGFKCTYVLPHLPLTLLLPHPLESVYWTMIFVLSGSTALLAVASVTGGGAPLACCIYASGGSNLNCCDPFDLPLDGVYNPNSVLTQPTTADFARALLDFAISGFISKLVGKAFEKYAPKWLLNPLKKWMIPIRKKAEDFVKNYIEEKVQPWKDALKDPSKDHATLRSLGVTHV